ncbi:flagellar assembly protein A, partial [Desulfofundulus sp.]|uniref:flagellar assembly protein A n=1 Tax=Desulfofundulus sp. TaxID=2282750 RepID=UPI003C7778FD
MVDEYPRLKVTISEDKMKAYVSAPEETAALKPESVYRALQEAGVVFGIKEHAVTSFAANPGPEPLLVAEGKPPQPGVDERLEVFFEGGAFPGRALDEEKRIDFRELNTIVSVEAGALLALKHPSQPGLPGRAVTGEELPPPAPLLLELRAGKGVELQAEGTRVVALLHGLP